MQPPIQTILIVDDSCHVRASLGAVLEHHGYAVATAGDGYEALNYLRTHDRPSVIMLDLTMPRMNGWVLREELRDDPALRSIPVVVLSGLGELHRETTDLNVFYLGKPPDFQVLLKILECYAPPQLSEDALAGLR